MENSHLPERRLGIASGAALVVSSMVGTGIFTTTGLLIRDLRSPTLVMLAWAIGGVIAMLGALTYSRLAIAIPQNGGEYTILSRLYHPSVGFIAGWVTLIAGFAAPLAAAAVAFSEYAGLPGGYRPAIGLVALWVTTLLELRSIVFGARLQLGITLAQLLLMLALVVTGLVWGDPSRLIVPIHGTPPSVFSATFGQGLIYVSYCYIGYNAATYVAGEIRRPERSLPRAMLVATGVVTLIYLLVNLVYLAAAPLNELAGAINIGAVSLKYLLGSWAGVATAVLVCVGLLAFMNATILSGPRVLAAICQDYPRLHRFAPERGKNPQLAILVQSIVATILVITASFEALLTYVGLILNLSTLLALLGVFRLKRLAPRHAPTRVVALAAGTASLLLVWSIAATAIAAPWTAATALATIALALVAYRALS